MYFILKHMHIFMYIYSYRISYKISYRISYKNFYQLLFEENLSVYIFLKLGRRTKTLSTSRFVTFTLN